MPTKDLHIATKQLLFFADYCKKNNLHGISHLKDVCEKIGYPINNYPKLRLGQARLTIDHIYQLAVVFKLDINWLFGLSKTMYLNKPKMTAIDELKLSVQRIENELSKSLTQ